MKEVTRFPTGVMGRVTEGRWAFQDTRKPWDEVGTPQGHQSTDSAPCPGWSQVPLENQESSMFVNLTLKEST